VAVVSRVLTKNEIERLREKARFAKTTKIATDAIAVITHKSNKDSILTVSDVRKILTGEYKNWKQINKNNKDLAIRVIFDNIESGIVRYMSDSVCEGQKFTDKAYAMDYNADVVDYVAKNEDAIGFIGASWISDPNDTLHLSFHKKIQVVGICIGDIRSYDDSYKPYQAYMRDHMYAFTRDIYMINTESTNGKATRFVNFMAGQRGQRLILKSGILPANTPTRVIQVRKDW
jgi:phosphate transport system substrate-binding protein